MTATDRTVKEGLTIGRIDHPESCRHRCSSQPGAREDRKALVSLPPIDHIGEPDGIAKGVVYLVSEESKLVTGSERVIDGGYMVR